MLGKFIAGDFIAIAGEMRRFTSSNENTDILMSVQVCHLPACTLGVNMGLYNHDNSEIETNLSV
jgi:hypothetical protein